MSVVYIESLNWSLCLLSWLLSKRWPDHSAVCQSCLMLDFLACRLALPSLCWRSAFCSCVGVIVAARLFWEWCLALTNPIEFNLLGYERLTLLKWGMTVTDVLWAFLFTILHLSLADQQQKQRHGLLWYSVALKTSLFQKHNLCCGHVFQLVAVTQWNVCFIWSNRSL